MAISEQWTSPSDLEVGVGDLPRASWANAILGSLAFNHGGPRLTLTTTEQLTVADSTFVTVPWGQALVDIGGWWDPTSPKAIIVPRDGLYEVSLNVLWGENADGDRGVHLAKDGDRVRGDRRRATPFTEQSPTWQTGLRAGRTLSIQVRQTSGAFRYLAVHSAPWRSVLLMARWAGPLDGQD